MLRAAAAKDSAFWLQPAIGRAATSAPCASCTGASSRSMPCFLIVPAIMLLPDGTARISGTISPFRPIRLLGHLVAGRAHQHVPLRPAVVRYPVPRRRAQRDGEQPRSRSGDPALDPLAGLALHGLRANHRLRPNGQRLSMPVAGTAAAVFIGYLYSRNHRVRCHYL